MVRGDQYLEAVVIAVLVDQLLGLFALQFLCFAELGFVCCNCYLLVELFSCFGVRGY